MPIDCLPPHLQAHRLPDGDGTDHDNKAQRYWDRAWRAFGPRAASQRWTFARQGVPYARWSIPVPIPLVARWRLFPRLLVGYNIARWMGVEDNSILFIGRFVKKMFWPWTSLYQVPAIEMRDGHARKDQSFTAMIRGRAWNAADKKFFTAEMYGPSPIQNFAFGFSWALTWPLFFQFSYRRRREGQEDFVFNFHAGARWDSGDMYFVFPEVFLGLAWN